MKTNRYYKIGGVMKCCIGTLREADVQEVKGEKVMCKYCKDGFVYNGDIWEKYWAEGKPEGLK